jgi:hypothetical protein
MYLQITTKCNMKCEHCCYSCTMHGKHMDYDTAVQAMDFCRRTEGDEAITIGGGEPTLHPKFFDILKHCLMDFNYVWMATNGSQTEVMLRLHDILSGNDFENAIIHQEEVVEGEDPEENIEYDEDSIINADDKLTVALSLDCFHEAINQRVIDIWKRAAVQHKRTGYEIRNVTESHDGPIAEGRGERTGAGYSKGCVCSDLLIRPDGKIKLCGCNKAPVIGDIWKGIEEKWEDVMQNNEKFQDERCYKSLRKGGKDV